MKISTRLTFPLILNKLSLLCHGVQGLRNFALSLLSLTNLSSKDTDYLLVVLAFLFPPGFFVGNLFV
jgi:hypothetical protein